MSTNATGRVIDEHGSGLPDLQVRVVDESALPRRHTGITKTDPGGSFTVGPYDENPHGGPMPARTFTLLILDPRTTRRVHTEPLTDVPGTLNIGDIVISSSDLHAFVVSGGVGAASRLTTGNAIRFLVDNVDAWVHFSDIVGAATTSVDFMQLEL